MAFKTDIAYECYEQKKKTVLDGVKISEQGGVTVVDVLNENGAAQLGKDIGRYITCEVKELSDNSEIFDGRLEETAHYLSTLLPEKYETVFVAGLGNPAITADALGAQTLKYVLSTRHISAQIKSANNSAVFKSVCSAPAGVLGETGIESAEVVKGISDEVKPDVIITVDALACDSPSRLGTTVQMSDSGIAPGSGVGNHRREITQNTMGVPVVSIGIPTVVNSSLFGSESESDELFVTPREIDAIILRGAKIIGMSINAAVQKNINIKDLFFLLG